MTIEKITLEGTSGWGSIYEAYKDKLIILKSGIKYEYKPQIEDPSVNPYIKWSYTTNGETYKEYFERITHISLEILKESEEQFATDIYPVKFTVTFEDKHRETKEFYYLKEEYSTFYELVQELIPSCESIPKVLEQCGA